MDKTPAQLTYTRGIRTKVKQVQLKLLQAGRDLTMPETIEYLADKELRGSDS